ncbi:MAG: FAD-dependent oxidoreductase [Actinobacteria bacterium]|nr:FAD-dependent oxidoreductase [Actinomycetota bacterium]MCL5071824.1 FAD-dependent oxidoreductase [Actinomycetota bacterium]
MINNIYKDLVVIGGNVSGLAAASQAKRVDPSLDIKVLESGDYISYGACGMPYFISGSIEKIDDLFAYPPSFFEEKRNIKILLNHKVVSINPFKKEILFSSKVSGALKYDKLIICSGASPIVLNTPGINAKNIFNFRNISDAINLKSFIRAQNPKNAVVIGGGSVGLLIAEALNKIGIKVTIIEKSKKIFKDYEDEITGILIGKIKSSQISILPDLSINSILENKNTGLAFLINATNTKDGISEKIEIETDLILLAAGVEANTDFIGNSFIEIGEKKAIKVNSKQQTSYANIYAAGDCCLVKNFVTNKYDFIPTANNAIKTGRIAGSNAAGEDENFAGSLGTKADKFFGLEIARTGIGLENALDFRFNAFKITDTYQSHIKAIPGSEAITITVIADKNSKRLLGVQMIGKECVGKRIDILAAAISKEMTVNEIYMLDLSYAPEISTVLDPVNKICAKASLEIQKMKF